MQEPLLVVDDVHKHYGGVRALRGVRLAVEQGEIHGLVGENGSGKSTFLKILAGQVRADAGRIVIDGRTRHLASPPQAIAAGIVTVTQETTLVPDMSISENVLLGHRAVRRRGRIDWRATHRRAQAVLDQLDLAVSPETHVRTLSPDQQQMVEIARAVSMDARILILDEPTSSLTDDEVQALFAVLRRLRGQGVGVIFVSHRLNEIMTLTDRVTVFRDGLHVETGRTADYDAEGLITAMIGRELAAQRRHAHDEPPEGHARLRVSRLSVDGLLHDISLHVRPGEALGLAGLVGSGRSELLQTIAGLWPTTRGTIEIDGRPAQCSTRREAIRRGVAYVPADRKVEGLVQNMSIEENVLMVQTALKGRWRKPSASRQQGGVRRIMDDFRVVADAPRIPVVNLSGGNQQKVMLAKWMTCNPKVLLLDEPTRGVDVGAKSEIYRLLERAKHAGAAVIVNSSESSELQTVCDRVLVMSRGRCTGEIPRRHADEATIARLAMGGASE